MNDYIKEASAAGGAGQGAGLVNEALDRCGARSWASGSSAMRWTSAPSRSFEAVADGIAALQTPQPHAGWRSSVDNPAFAIRERNDDRPGIPLMAAPVAIRVTYPSAGILNITPDALSVSVCAGARSSILAPARFQPAVRSDGRYRPGHEHAAGSIRCGGAASEADYNSLLDIQYSVRGALRWRGEAVARPCVRLWRAPPLVMGSAGQALAAAQASTVVVAGSGPQHVAGRVHGSCRHGGGRRARLEASKFPAGARLKQARSTGTLASSINALALTTGCIPVEGNDGALALTDISAIQPITGYVPGQTAVTRASVLEREPVIAQRLLQLFGTGTDEEPSATLASVTRVGRLAYYVAATYVWPDDVEDVIVGHADS